MISAYSDQGYAVIPNLLERNICSFFIDYCLVLLDAQRLKDDGHVVGSKVAYGDPAFDTLLARLQPAISEAVGLTLIPTYSFVRLYLEGQALPPHRDRPACEHSVTMHVGSSGGTWPLLLRSANDQTVSVDLGPGDALLYRGTERIHWRDPLTQTWYLQVFLHYVDSQGENTKYALDGRTGLGRARGY